MHSRTLKNLAVSTVVGTIGFIIPTFGALAGQAVTPNLGLATNTYPASSSLQSSLSIIVPSAPVITVQDGLDNWLDNLAMAESNGKDHIKILDVNGRYSYGCLQFQLGTFLSYGRKYGIVPDTLSNADLLKLIYNCSVQKEIARAMIEDNTANWRHWYTSVRYNKNVGMPPTAEVTAIEPVLAKVSN
jgi:hypothetical protein